jgi:hypothetical protein
VGTDVGDVGHFQEGIYGIDDVSVAEFTTSILRVSISYIYN